MSLIQVTVYDTPLTEETVPKLIEKMTDAMVECTSEELRAHTWVLVDCLPAKQWGVGGKPGA